MAHKLGVNASTNEVGKALVNHLRDVKDKANDYKTVTALSEFVVSMLPFVPKSKTFISKIPDKSKLSGYISTTAKTVKPNELVNAIKTGASIGAVLSGGDTDLQGTIANATAGGLGGATLHEGGKVVKEGTKLVGKISDNVKTGIEKTKYINELKKNPDNWVYETETKPTGKMRGLGLSQTPEMKTETKRVFSPFVDVDNMKSGAYKEKISKTDYKELGNKKNEVEVWKPNHELGESGELKQGSLYGNVSANGVVNQGGSTRPLLVDKQNPNYEEDKKNYLKTIEAIKNGTFKTGSRIKVLSKTPIIWQQYGLPNKRFLMKKETFKKASNIPNRKKVNHDVGDDVLNNLPDLLQKPEYILKSSTEKNSFVGVLNANDKQGYPIVVAVKPIQDGLQVNLIQSVYGRKNFNNWITKQADNILYKKATSSPTTLSLENNLGQGDKDVTNNIITDNSETFKGGVEESNITPEKQKELEKQEKINWERTLKRRDNVDIEIIKRAANLKNGKKYSTGEIKMLIGSARRGTLNTPSLRSRFDKLMKLVEEPDDRTTVQGGLSEFTEFHNPNATDEELVNEAINNLLHNRKPLNITEKANDYGKHIEQMYNDIETSNNIIRTGNNYEERANIYLDETTKLINKYGEEIPQDTFINLVKTVNEIDENIINPSYNNEQGVNNEQTTRNGIKSNIDKTGRGLQTQSPERNTRRINRNNDSNNEQSREISRNEYTQETSTNKRTDVTEELETKSNKYEDYGEKISGAKKDLWSSYKDKLSEKISNSADEITLSKAFPEPNYESLLKSGIDKNLLATIKAIRDSIPDKPRSKYQVSRKEDWVNAIKVSRAFVNKLISGEVSLDEFDNGIKTSSLKDKIDLYRKIGYPSFNNVKDYSIEFSNGYYIKDGKRLDKPTSLYGLYKKTGKRTRHLINTFDTKEQAIERLKQELSNIDNTPKKKDVPLSVWKWQGKKSINGWCIGKKIGTGKYVDLKTGFKTHTEAREYLNVHKNELVEQLYKLKEEPQTRGLTNRDRIGKEYREGNVTPEQLANTFGFRGVQFGNYVEGNKRISDVNRCFDAFADLANVLNIPEKAVSLNGELGIAFGARGNGGKNSASAHYEPNQVVINLTKKNGAGCLAHEWWHALDNYFGKMNDSEFVTETYTKRSNNIRQEMVDAFKNISKVVRESLYERSKNVDKYRSKDYWSTTREMTARAFEKYIVAKAKEQGITNDYLANILGDSVVDNETSTYPLKAEMDGIIKAYDNFFDKVKTKETDKGVALYSRTNEPQSKSSKITSNDVANIISSGKTIGEMVETSPVLSVLKDEIAGLEDYTIAPMTDKEKGNGLRGIHYRDTKLITLNMEAINDKYEAVEVLAHELQHAKQGQEYHKIVNEYGLNKEDIKNLDRIANAELYKKDSVPAQVVAKHLKNKIRRKGLSSNELEKLINYHKCGIVNTKMNDCYNVNPELIENIIDETRGFNSKQEIKRYIIDNYGRKSYNIFADYMNSFRNYETAINEIEANNFGYEIKEKLKGVDYERLYARNLGYVPEVREEWNVRTGYENSSTINKGKNPTSRERGQARMDKGTLSKLQRELTDAQRGIADDTSIDDVYNTDKVLKKVKKEPDSIVKDLIIPISSRLDEIAPALKHKLRRFEMESSLSENNLMKEVKPFIDKVGKMKSIDWAKYDLALKNGNIDLIQRFNEQYNLNDEYKAMQLMSFFILVDFYLVDYFTIFLRCKKSFISYEILLLQGL